MAHTQHITASIADKDKKYVHNLYYDGKKFIDKGFEEIKNK